MAHSNDVDDDAFSLTATTRPIPRSSRFSGTKHLEARVFTERRKSETRERIMLCAFILTI